MTLREAHKVIADAEKFGSCFVDDYEDAKGMIYSRIADGWRLGKKDRIIYQIKEMERKNYRERDGLLSNIYFALNLTLITYKTTTMTLAS